MGVYFRVGVSAGPNYKDLVQRNVDPYRVEGDKAGSRSRSISASTPGKTVNVIFNTHESMPGASPNDLFDFAVFGRPASWPCRSRDGRGVRPLVLRPLPPPAGGEGRARLLPAAAWPTAPIVLDVVQGIVVGEEFLALLMRQAFGTHVGSPVLAFAPPGHYYSPIPVEEGRRALGHGTNGCSRPRRWSASTSTSTAS
jgi:hypothetical protein